MSAVNLDAVVRGVTVVTIILIMLSMGLALTLRQVSSLLLLPALLLRSLLAAVLLPPLIALLAVRLFAPPTPISVAIVLLAAAPGASLAPKLAARAGGDVPYAISLMAVVALLAVVTTPLALLLALPGAAASPFEIGRTVLINQLIPLAIGLAIRAFWSRLADVFAGPTGRLASLLLPLLIALILLQNLETILGMGLVNLIAMSLVILLTLAAGHVLGGRRRATRAPLALTSAYRNGALALLVATSSFIHSTPYVAAYEAVALVFCVAYIAAVLWRERSALSAPGALPVAPQASE
jgi:BASS family bile acid:Na+ symporter